MNRLSTVSFALILGLNFLTAIGTARAGTETVLYSFCSQANCADGSYPNGALIDATGLLYGATGVGGNNDACTGGGCGTIFSVNPQSGVEAVLHAFDGEDGSGPDGVIDVNSVLYGTTRGIYFGQNCLEAMCGSLFSLNLADNNETVLYSFCSQARCADGADPINGVISAGSMLYGSTSGGGGIRCVSNPCGTVFSFDLATSVESTLHSFPCRKGSCSGGGVPGSPVDISGVLYGTTSYGGGGAHCSDFSSCGTVFSLDPASGAETVVYSFCSQAKCMDGASPNAGLIKADGILYGTTHNGGAGKRGTVFAFNPITRVVTVLYSFCSLKHCADGSYPIAGVIKSGESLYGTTVTGGSGTGDCFTSIKCGTVFAFNLKTGAEKVLYSFCSQANCTDGAFPEAALLDVGGTLYGTTDAGGAGANCTTFGGCGTVFAVKP